MRPSTNFALHAALAAVLAALAASSAAAGKPIIDNEGYVYLSRTLMGQRVADGSERLKLRSLAWGTAADSANLGGWTKVDGLDVSWDVPEARVSKIDSFTVKQGVVEQGARAGSVGANETMTIGSARTESGLPTGKRMHKPFTLSGPAGKGSVWIRVSSPWSGCRVGERYPLLELGSGGKAYAIHDAVVAGCARSGEMVAFEYAKVSVRGWDPKKKESVAGEAR